MFWFYLCPLCSSAIANAHASAFVITGQQGGCEGYGLTAKECRYLKGQGLAGEGNKGGSKANNKGSTNP